MKLIARTVFLASLIVLAGHAQDRLPNVEPMLVKSPGIGTWVTNKIGLVGPAWTENAAISDNKDTIVFMRATSSNKRAIENVTCL